MKRIVLAFMFMLFVSNAWAADQMQAVKYTTNTLIKSKAGMVCSAEMNYIGATAGNQVQLIDGTDQTGTVRLTLVAATTAGNQIMRYTPLCAYFGTGIYYFDAGHSGTVTTDIQSF